MYKMAILDNALVTKLGNKIKNKRFSLVAAWYYLLPLQVT